MEEPPTASAGSSHIVLLGDSIFDNGAYVSGGPDVLTQLKQTLPGWRCTLLAVDGDVIAGVSRQLDSLPSDAITRAAFSRGAALIDLRLICNEDADYANTIEPSSQGGQKIVQAIVSFTEALNPGGGSIVIAR